MGPAIFIPMAIGAVVRTGVGIAKGESFGDILKGVAISAGIGAVTGGIGSALGTGSSVAASTAGAAKTGTAEAVKAGATEAVSQGVGQAATQGAGEIATQGVAEAAKLAAPSNLVNSATQTATTPIAQAAQTASQPGPLVRDLNRLAYVSPHPSVSDIGSQTLTHKPLTIDQANALNNTTPMPTSTDGAIASFQKDQVQVQTIPDTPPLKTGSFGRPGPGSLLNPRRTPADISTMSDQYARYVKALEDQNKMQKQKMYIEGAKAGVDTVQAATAKEPRPDLRPMGYPQPIQLTGGNTDLMAQLMALAGGR